MGLFAPGPASIFVLPETLPPGVSLVQGTNPTFVVIPSNGEISASVVFQATTVLQGLVYNDLNGNGRQDLGEPGISGASISVATPGTTTPVAAVTNATGFWAAGVNVGFNIATVNVASLGLGAAVVQTQGTNPQGSSVASSQTVTQTPTGFRAAATQSSSTTPQPTTAPTSSGESESFQLFSNQSQTCLLQVARRQQRAPPSLKVLPPRLPRPRPHLQQGEG